MTQEEIVTRKYQLVIRLIEDKYTLRKERQEQLLFVISVFLHLEFWRDKTIEEELYKLCIKRMRELDTELSQHSNPFNGCNIQKEKVIINIETDEYQLVDPVISPTQRLYHLQFVCHLLIERFVGTFNKYLYGVAVEKISDLGLNN